MGNNKTWLDLANHVIQEVNSWRPIELKGVHDIHYGTALPPNRVLIPIIRPLDRIGGPTFNCDPEKIVAVVETNDADQNLPFKEPDQNSKVIAANIVAFFRHEVSAGRLPVTLLPLQSGVGNIVNAVLKELERSGEGSLVGARASRPRRPIRTSDQPSRRSRGGQWANGYIKTTAPR